VRTFRCIVHEEEEKPVWFESHNFGGDFNARGSVQCRDYRGKFFVRKAI
jgi:hypothetical protein